MEAGSDDLEAITGLDGFDLVEVRLYTFTALSPRANYVLLTRIVTTNPADQGGVVRSVRPNKIGGSEAFGVRHGSDNVIGDVLCVRLPNQITVERVVSSGVVKLCCAVAVAVFDILIRGPACIQNVHGDVVEPDVSCARSYRRARPQVDVNAARIYRDCKLTRRSRFDWR